MPNDLLAGLRGQLASHNGHARDPDVIAKRFGLPDGKQLKAKDWKRVNEAVEAWKAQVLHAAHLLPGKAFRQGFEQTTRFLRLLGVETGSPTLPRDHATLEWLRWVMEHELNGTLDRYTDQVKSAVLYGQEFTQNPTDVAARLYKATEDANRDWRLVAQTEMARANVLGRLAGCQEMGFDEVWIPPHAGACKACKRLIENKVFPAELLAKSSHENWGKPEREWIPAVPQHPRCFVPKTEVLGNYLSATSRPYDGEVVRINAASGKELTCTPNHPILTGRGWVPAGEINVGDNLIRCDDLERAVSFIDPDHKRRPAPIGEIAEALPVILGEMPASPEDFHGDGLGSDIYVIHADGSLGDYLNASLAKPANQGDLGRALVAERLLHSEGVSFPLRNRNGSSSHSGVSAFDLGHSFPEGDIALVQMLEDGSRGTVELRADTLGAQAVLDVETNHLIGGEVGAMAFGIPTDRMHLDVGGFECAGGRAMVDVQPLHNGAQAFPAYIGADDLLGINEAGSSDGEGNPSLVENAAYLASGETVGARERLDGFAALVETDEVLGVARAEYSGHVYNLETEDGWYLANGYITSNCRHIPVPWVADVYQEAQDEYEKMRESGLDDDVLAEMFDSGGQLRPQYKDDPRLRELQITPDSSKSLEFDPYQQVLANVIEKTRDSGITVSKGFFDPPQASLDPLIWEPDEELKADVRTGIIDFWTGVLGDGWQKWAGVYITGSATSYQWGTGWNHPWLGSHQTQVFPDVDTHLVLDYDGVRKARPLWAGMSPMELRKLLEAWVLKAKDGVEIAPGLRLDAYIRTEWSKGEFEEDVRHTGQGVYDVVKDRWLILPTYPTAGEVYGKRILGGVGGRLAHEHEDWVRDAELASSQLETLLNSYNENPSEDNLEALQSMMDSLYEARTAGFLQGAGQEDRGNWSWQYLENYGPLLDVKELLHRMA